MKFELSFSLLTFYLFVFLSISPVNALTDAEVSSYQKEIANRSIGEKIAFWAEKFIDTPYDPDPLGSYVTKMVIVNDEVIDCMYLSFRVIELALSKTPEEAIEIALDKRFLTRGIMREGKVINYDERFQYGEDMLDSGKWGKELTSAIGRVEYISGSRGRGKIPIISKEEMLSILKEMRNPLESGDFIYFVKYPENRQVGEIVGHIGVIKKEGEETFLIHASGSKDKGGIVKKVPLVDYIRSMPFAGVRVGRFTNP